MVFYLEIWLNFICLEIEQDEVQISGLSNSRTLHIRLPRGWAPVGAQKILVSQWSQIIPSAVSNKCSCVSKSMWYTLPWFMQISNQHWKWKDTLGPSLISKPVLQIIAAIPIPWTGAIFISGELQAQSPGTPFQDLCANSIPTPLHFIKQIGFTCIFVPRIISIYFSNVPAPSYLYFICAYMYKTKNIPTICWFQLQRF